MARSSVVSQFLIDSSFSSLVCLQKRSRVWWALHRTMSTVCNLVFQKIPLSFGAPTLFRPLSSSTSHLTLTTVSETTGFFSLPLFCLPSSLLFFYRVLAVPRTLIAYNQSFVQIRCVEKKKSFLRHYDSHAGTSSGLLAG